MTWFKEFSRAISWEIMYMNQNYLTIFKSPYVIEEISIKYMID